MLYMFRGVVAHACVGLEQEAVLLHIVGERMGKLGIPILL
jgi:hypothetical protein